MNSKTPKATSFHHALQKILSGRIQKVKSFSWSPNLTNQKFLTSILCKCWHKRHVLHVSLFVQKEKKNLRKIKKKKLQPPSTCLFLFIYSLHHFMKKKSVFLTFFPLWLRFFLSNYDFFFFTVGTNEEEQLWEVIVRLGVWLGKFTLTSTTVYLLLLNQKNPTAPAAVGFFYSSVSCLLGL